MFVLLILIQYNSNHAFSMTRLSAACIFVPSFVQWALLLHLVEKYSTFPSCYQRVWTFIVCVVLLRIQYNSHNTVNMSHSPAACIFVPSNVQWAPLLHLAEKYPTFLSCYQQVWTFIVFELHLRIQYNSHNAITMSHSPAACIFVPSNVQWALQ